MLKITAGGLQTLHSYVAMLKQPGPGNTRQRGCWENQDTEADDHKFPLEAFDIMRLNLLKPFHSSSFRWPTCY